MLNVKWLSETMHCVSPINAAKMALTSNVAWLW